MNITTRDYRKLLNEVRELRACCCKSINTVENFADLPDAGDIPEERFYIVESGPEAGLYVVIDGVWTNMSIIGTDVSDAVYGAGWNGSLLPPTQNAVYDRIEILANDVNNIVTLLPVTTYKALLVQTGTNAPTDTILVNTFGGALTWNYVDVGEYNLIAVEPEFVEGRTFINIPYSAEGHNNGVIAWSWVNVNTIKIHTFVGPNHSSAQADDILGSLTPNGVPILIEVYP